jgi:hypothetical protein
MERYARESQAEISCIENISPPFSFFQFVDQQFSSAWPLRRILSQVRMYGGKTMVIEELSLNESNDLYEENDDLEKKIGGKIKSRIRRLSFFSKAFSTKRGLLLAGNEIFIGYAIIKDDELSSETISRIYESVILPSKRQNNFIRGSQKWDCRVGPAKFQIEGYLYAQQNDKTNICAHVACRTAAARFHVNGDMTYREMNNLPELNIDHVKKTVGDGVGLDSDQIVAILKAAGARCIVADYTQPKSVPPPPFQKYLYGSIESGYPAILCFATKHGPCHAVPVIGHTFNEDMWVANAELAYFRVGAKTEYIPSESWLSTYIAHDDNWGSNYCIPRHFLYAKKYCEQWPGGPQPCKSESDCVAYVIATLPKNIKVNPIDAEVIGVDYLMSILTEIQKDPSSFWVQQLEQYAQGNMLVIRPILINTSEYTAHLNSMLDWDDKHIRQDIIRELKTWPQQNIWMIELSVPELFSANRRKLGEVLILADIFAEAEEERDFKNYFLARIPGFFALYVGGTSNNYSFLPSGIETHVPIFGCDL